MGATHYFFGDKLGAKKMLNSKSQIVYTKKRQKQQKQLDLPEIYTKRLSTTKGVFFLCPLYKKINTRRKNYDWNYKYETSSHRTAKNTIITKYNQRYITTGIYHWYTIPKRDTKLQDILNNNSLTKTFTEE